MSSPVTSRHPSVTAAAVALDLGSAMAALRLLWLAPPEILGPTARLHLSCDLWLWFVAQTVVLALLFSLLAKRLGREDRFLPAVVAASVVAAVEVFCTKAGARFAEPGAGIGYAALALAVGGVMFAGTRSAIRRRRGEELAALERSFASLGFCGWFFPPYLLLPLAGNAARIEMRLWPFALAVLVVAWLRDAVRLDPPRRFQHSRFLLAPLALLAAHWCLRGSAPADENTRNVVLISIDTTRADHLGCYGFEEDTTPHLDAFAREGIRFAHVLSPYPLTNPTHTSMLTGLYAANHHVVLNSPMGMAEWVRTLPEDLIGHHSAAFVSGFPLKRRMSAQSSRFDLYDDDFSPSPLVTEPFFQLGLPGRLLESLRGGDVRNGAHERRGDRTVDRALSWLATHHDQRFFLFVHLYDPHGPYQPPAPYDRLFDPDYQGHANGNWYRLSAEEKKALLERPDDVRHLEALYAGEIRFADEQVGRLIDALSTPELRANTVIAVVSDHGESLTERGEQFDHGHSLYDATLRVPWILRLPGQEQAGRVVEEPVSLLDVYPTLFELSRPRDPVLHNYSLDGVSRTGLAGIEPLERWWAPANSEAPPTPPAGEPRPLFATIYRQEIESGEASVYLESIAARGPRFEYLSHGLEPGSIFQPDTESFFDLESDPRQLDDRARDAALHEEFVALRNHAIGAAHAWSHVTDLVPTALRDADREALEALGYLEKEGGRKGEHP